MRQLLLSLGLLNVFITGLNAQSLEWQTQELEHKATVDETFFKATFLFNVLEGPLEILDIKTSCGCTTAELAKTLYQEGESGEITAHFEYGTRSGAQSKTIQVITSKETYDLRLNVEIPVPVQVEPRLVLWRETEGAVEKTVHIIETDFEIESVSFETKSETLWDISYVSSDEGGELKIAPRSYQNRKYATVSLAITFKDGRVRKELVYLRMI